MSEIGLRITSEKTRNLLLNRAEGSGSSSKKEFKQFLNIARRSTFENANILILLQKRNHISSECLDIFLIHLDRLCRQITNFQGSLN